MPLGGMPPSFSSPESCVVKLCSNPVGPGMLHPLAECLCSTCRYQLCSAPTAACRARGELRDGTQLTKPYLCSFPGRPKALCALLAWQQLAEGELGSSTLLVGLPKPSAHTVVRVWLLHWSWGYSSGGKRFLLSLLLSALPVCVTDLSWLSRALRE